MTKSISPSGKLWDKGAASNNLMLALTVGDDPIYDKELIKYDCLGTKAHALALSKIGIISNVEYEKIVTALNEIYADAKFNKIDIPYELEDCHTTLENILIEKLGDLGKKIHTGRSRNDQVLVTVRLYLKDALKSNLSVLLQIAEVLKDKYKSDKDIFLPGYTHLQPAMPSSVGMWIHACFEGVLDLLHEGHHLIERLNQNPLGAAAGFGSSLPIDRKLTANELGFNRVQRSFIDIQNSRGRFEERYLFWLTQVANIFEKFIWDIHLFLTKEFNFATLLDELTTGSSIMPQKRNPDLVELTRGRCAMLRGVLSQMQWITGKLPSNYHRDLQLTKAPLFQGIKEGRRLLDSIHLIFSSISFKINVLESRKDNELYATYAAYKKVKDGVAFRDAYKETAQNVLENKIKSTDYQNEFSLITEEIQEGMQAAQKEFDALFKQIRDIV